MEIKYETGICFNCGADRGLHHYETMQCPKNGREAPLNKKQEWERNIFQDSGLMKLHDAAPELLEALDWILTNLEFAEECVVAYHLIKDNPKKSFTDITIKRKKLAEKYIFKAIKNATE